MTYIPRKNEVTFNVKPMGVAYECEFCHKGEMEADTSRLIVVDMNGVNMIKHFCNKCGAQLDLPRVYPYIEWIRDDEEKKEDNNESD